jgi:hypothetical protein
MKSRRIETGKVGRDGIAGWQSFHGVPGPLPIAAGESANHQHLDSPDLQSFPTGSLSLFPE